MQSDPDETLDPEAMFFGRIAWTADEFSAVSEFERQVRETPHDDWNRRPRRFVLDGADGAKVYGFNPDKVENQVMDFMVSRYRHLPLSIGASHMHRYFVMHDFLRRNWSRLREDRVVLVDDKTGEQQILDRFLETLAESSYDAETVNLGGHAARTFDYDSVVALTKRRSEAEEGPEDKL